MPWHSPADGRFSWATKSRRRSSPGYHYPAPPFRGRRSRCGRRVRWCTNEVGAASSPSPKRRLWRRSSASKRTHTCSRGRPSRARDVLASNPSARSQPRPISSACDVARITCGLVTSTRRTCRVHGVSSLRALPTLRSSTIGYARPTPHRSPRWRSGAGSRS